MIPARGGVLIAGLWALTVLTACTPATTPGPPPTSAASLTSVPPTSVPPTAIPTPIPSSGGCEWTPCYTAPTDDGSLPRDVDEASGIVASGVDPGLFFVVDDASRTDSIQAVRADGTPVASITVDGMRAVNAEALSSGVCAAGSSARCLYVGDIGGNSGRREVTVLRVPEPAAPLPASVTADAWTYTYPDGSYNAEALLVADDGGIVVITKPDRGTLPHRVYVGPPGGGDLVLHSTFRPPDPTSPARSILVGNVVTDAARTPDTVLLLTYDQAVEYRAPGPGADPADFASWAWRRVPIPDQWQSEGIAYRADGCGYVVVSERSPFGSAAIGGAGCA